MEHEACVREGGVMCSLLKGERTDLVSVLVEEKDMGCVFKHARPKMPMLPSR